MMIGYGFIMIGITLIIRGWTSVYYRGDRLLREGMYGATRHPQYTGIFLIIFGQLVHWPTILTIALAPLIVSVYVHLARREEAHLIERFGDAYRVYQRDVPMFMPGWRRLREAFAI